MASATARVAAQIQSQLSPPSMASVGLASLETDERMAAHHRFAAVRAHCHELAGDRVAAAAGYAGAARTATSLPERRYLEARAAELATAGTGDARAAIRAREACAAGKGPEAGTAGKGPEADAAGKGPAPNPAIDSTARSLLPSAPPPVKHLLACAFP